MLKQFGFATLGLVLAVIGTILVVPVFLGSGVFSLLGFGFWAAAAAAFHRLSCVSCGTKLAQQQAHASVATSV